MAAGNASPDLGAVKVRQQQMWATGDYAEVGARLQIVSEMLCEAVDLRAGERVLDVATGSGNTALAAARRFCDVTGIDYVPALLERGRERAEAERLPVDFREGDAEQLDLPDTSFDVVLSTFGQMFAPDQQRTASEMLRVCRSGGRVGMANWTPEGFIGEIFRTIGRHVPPPPGVAPPARWGTEDGLRDLFGDGVSSMDVARRTYVFRFLSPEHWLEFFQTHYGPTVTAFGRLDAAGQAGLGGDILDVLRRFNRSESETLAVPSEYLEVVAIRA
jgi:SAM-dependent methyltransferase